MLSACFIRSCNTATSSFDSFSCSSSSSGCSTILSTNFWLFLLALVFWKKLYKAHSSVIANSVAKRATSLSSGLYSAIEINGPPNQIKATIAVITSTAITHLLVKNAFNAFSTFRMPLPLYPAYCLSSIRWLSILWLIRLILNCSILILFER